MKNKVNKMKLFKEKAGMTGTTKFNFMKHLPNHQPNRSRFAMVFLLFMTFLLGSVQGWGQVAQRGTATTSAAALSGSSRVLTINKPTNVVAGDVMIASIVQNETDNDNGGLSPNTLAGWTLIKGVLIRSDGTDNGDNAWYGTCLYKIATGSEGNSYSFVMPNDRADMAIGSIVAFSGVATNALQPDGTSGGPFDVVPGNFNNANSATATATGLTIANNNSALVMIAMVNDNNTVSSWSNSLNQLYDNSTSSEDDAQVAAAWTSCNLSGATQDRTVTISASDRNSAILLALRSASVVTVGSPSSTPTLCQNTALTNITHTTTGASGIGTAVGLPAGVSASYSSNTITISGSPTATGTFNYSIPITPGCVLASGTITVLPRPTSVTASSSASTICSGSSINLTSSATSNSNTATTLLNENFNGAALPSGWTTTNTSGGGTVANAAWTLRPNGYNSGSQYGVTINSNDASQFYLTDSDMQGSNGTSTATTLRSPSFSTIGLNSASLTFYHYFRFYTNNSAIVEITTNNGSSWTALATYNSTDVGSSSAFTLTTISLASYLGQANVSIRFRYQGVYGYYWALDNVRVSGTLTTPPAATFAWTSAPAGFTSSTQNPTAVSPSVNTVYTVTATNNYGCTATATTTVNVNNVTSGSIGSSQTICSGGNPNAFTSTNGTGSGTITYRWESNTNLTTPSWSTIPSQTAATYDVPSGLTTTTQYRRITISTLNGVACESDPTSSVQVTVNPNPVATISAGGATTFCQGGSVTLTAPSGGSTYVWSNAGTQVSSGTSNSFVANQNGLYTVTVTNSNNCSATSSATAVTVNPIVTPTFTQVSAICSGASLSALPTTSNNSITGTWSPALNNTATTTYTFTPTAGQCASTASMTISVNSNTTPTFTQVSAICSGASLNALPTTSNNSITGTWSPALNNTATTTYTFTPTAGQCATTATMTITVNPFVTPTFTQVSAICSGASLSALPTTSNNGITGSWSPALNNTATTTYTFTPTAGQCASTASMTITVNPVLTASVSISASATGVCTGNSITLTAVPTNGGDSPVYVWKKNGVVVSGQNNTTFTSGSFANGDVITCEMTSNASPCLAGSPATSNSVTITVHPIVTPTFTQVSSICSGASLSALPTTSNNSITGTWSPALNNTATTTYTFTPAAGQCATTATMTIAVAPTSTYYQDIDQDGFGNLSVSTSACTQPNGYVSDAGDCDDNNAAANPDATELCENTFDDNCDGNISEEFPGASLVTYYLDQDSDGSYSANSVQMCAAPSGLYTTQAPLVADCNDNNSNIKPGGVEICGNNIDEDCNDEDLVPSYYISLQSGSWNSLSTWNYSCFGNDFQTAVYAPEPGYTGIIEIAAGTNVTIPADNEEYSAGTLVIKANGSLSLTGNNAVSVPTASTNVSIAKLTVLNTIQNNGTLTVGHMASLLQSNEVANNVNTGTGNFVVNMNLTGTSNAGGAPNGRYWYIGSPMNNTNISNTFYSATHKTRIWDYLPATNAWSAIINGTTGFGQGSATNMTVGLGYLYRAGSNQTVTFTGNASQFNNNITTPLSFTGTGYKYVANPYTSYVDWRAVTRTGLNVSYWIRNAANTSYESYNATSNLSTNNGSGQTTQFIPPMQGFWIYAFTTPCSLRMDNGDRRHSSNILHAPIHNQVVRLNLNDGKTDDQAVVYENENASNGIEEYDTDKFMDENYHQVYFLEGTKQVSLNGLKDATAKQKVDMGIQITGAGTYTINAVELGIEEDVMLEDKFTHTFQDLKRNSTYSFTSNAGTYNNRFVLHFTLNPQTETVLETETVTVGETVGESEGVTVYTTTGQQVKVWVTNTTDFQNATVKVYDAIGNMIERKNMTSSELYLDLDIASGIYVVEVTGDSKVFTKKIFITK